MGQSKDEIPFLLFIAVTLETAYAVNYARCSLGENSGLMMAWAQTQFSPAIQKIPRSRQCAILAAT